ncbi:MAG: hypothetical protein EA397_19020 [Deltaproteobacteria bacterium]|nr:MAG: hypothetical protein EA397_19020 [Deltaproteobacteria bacterium]
MSPSYARRPPSSSGSSTPERAEEQASSNPDWLSSLSMASPHADTFEAVTGLQIDEEQATAVLDRASEILGEDRDETRPEWAEEYVLTGEVSWPRSPRPQGRLGEVHDAHARALPSLSVELSATQEAELAHFKRQWEANRTRYEEVAAITGVPAILIAGIHYRESSMDFDTYLHQGDPLGRPAVNHPSDIPIFYEWEEAAIHALDSKRGLASSVGLDEDTRDLTAIATYAEAYNGLGYHFRDRPSPYVYAGTDHYQGGLFVADGVYDPQRQDGRLGVVALAMSVGEVDPAPPTSSVVSPEWRAVREGEQTLQVGSRGDGVRDLQVRLNEQGAALQPDGVFGPATRAALERFQRSAGLPVTGVADSNVATALIR